MRWQKAARIALAAAGISGAAAIYFLARDRPEQTPTGSLTPVDPTAKGETGQGTTLRYSGGDERVRYSYDAMRSYGDRDVLLKAHVLFEADGLELWSDEIERRTSGAPPNQTERFTLTGNVRLRTNDGLDLRTDSATYDPADGGTLLMPGPVTFSKGRVSGTGDGASYIRAQELFKLNENANVNLQPDEAGAGAARARSRSMTLARLEHFARLEEGAVIERATETLAADSATIYFTEDETQLRLVDMRGRAKVTPTTPGSGPPDMSGDTISLTVHPDGHAIQRSTLTGNAALAMVDAAGRRSITGAWIDASTAPDGRTVTALAARERVVVDLPARDKSPARRIEANTLNATGDPKRGLTQARFEGAPVRFTETRDAAAKGATREGTARRLDLKLAGQLDAIDDAEFRERVRFTDGTSQAAAERAVYKASADQLELHTVDGHVPHVERRDLSVDGNTITLDIGADRLDASGTVRTLSRPSGRDASKRGGLFDEKQDVIGAAARLQFDGGKGTATYTGAATAPASLTQGASRVAGQQIVLDDKSGNLTASGSVDSTMEIEDQAGGGRGEGPAPSRLLHRITADQLVYEDAARRAVYTGTAQAPARLTRPDGSTDAARIELLLAAGSRTLRELRASGQVYAKMEPDNEAKGDRLIYDAETQLYTLHGLPGQDAVAKVPDEGRKGCWRLTGPVIRFRRSGAQPDTDQRTRSETIECRVSIR